MGAAILWYDEKDPRGTHGVLFIRVQQSLQFDRHQCVCGINVNWLQFGQEADLSCSPFCNSNAVTSYMTALRLPSSTHFILAEYQKSTPVLLAYRPRPGSAVMDIDFLMTVCLRFQGCPQCPKLIISLFWVPSISYIHLDWRARVSHHCSHRSGLSSHSRGRCFGWVPVSAFLHRPALVIERPFCRRRVLGNGFGRALWSVITVYWTCDQGPCARARACLASINSGFHFWPPVMGFTSLKSCSRVDPTALHHYNVCYWTEGNFVLWA